MESQIMETNSIEELEQDIEALNAEVKKLQEKLGQLHDQLRHPERLAKLDSNDPTLSDFNDLFNGNPELRELLLGYEIEKHIEVHEDNSEPQTPRKKAKLSPSKNLKDMPEHEWVLNTQPLVQHKLFNEGLSDLIDTEILISPSKRRQKINSDTSHLEANKDVDSILRENLFRMFGISFFPVVDPNDLEYNDDRKLIEVKRDMLGIRFDVFNQSVSRYEKPHYILLKKDTKSDKWGVFKYTIPNYIDVHGIFNDTNGGILKSYDEVYLFAKQINILLIQKSIRIQILLDLEAKSVIEKLDMDLQATIASFSRSNFKFEIIIKENSITSCSLKSSHIPEELKTSIEFIIEGPLDELGSKLKSIDFQELKFN